MLLIYFAINLRSSYLRFAGEALRVKTCFGTFCFVNQTGLLSILLPFVHIYVMKFFQN